MDDAIPPPPGQFGLIQPAIIPPPPGTGIFVDIPSLIDVINEFAGPNRYAVVK